MFIPEWACHIAGLFFSSHALRTSRDHGYEIRNPQIAGASNNKLQVSFKTYQRMQALLPRATSQALIDHIPHDPAIDPA